MKILNFGSMNIDYVYNVDEIVTPGETISSSNMSVFCGGKGLNQSIAVARSGVPIYHAGIIGNEGKILLDILNENKVNTEYVKKSNSSNGHAIIQLNKKGQNSILLFGGTNQMIDETFVDEVLINFSTGDFLILQNEISCMEYIIERAYSLGLRIVLNPSPITNVLLNLPLEKVEYFIVNEIEAAALSGSNDLDKAIISLHNKYPNSKIVMTVGKDGVQYYDGNKLLKHGIYDVKVVDTTAAGDTFLGYFVSSISIGEEVESALKKASIASSIAVSRMGAAPSIPTIDEVNSFSLKI